MKRKMLIIQFTMLALSFLVLGAVIFSSCNQEDEGVETFVVHPEWSKDAIIYEVNVRQFTPEGTFKAFEEHLPRLKELGVDIVWLMPIHPIGELKRKGGLGSYYSIKDYTAVNPEFGDLNDFKSLVAKAHELDMYVILDWVANHTAWDHEWVTEHPEWYNRNEDGEIVSPYDWTDVADLDFNNKDLYPVMLDEMKYWVEEADIDGFRCDVAGMVPVEFWNMARAELDKTKPVFMLAEAEEPIHHEYAFDMSYGWELHHIMNEIAQGKKNAIALDEYFAKVDTLYPHDAYRMYFITNHDENSWNGTEYERMGKAANTFALLTYTLPGMPLIYSGQEAALNERLAFFEKDTIKWGDYELASFYQNLGKLRKENPALWCGEAGGTFKKLKSSEKENIYAFLRKADDGAVVVITNLSGKSQDFTIKMKEGKSKEAIDWETGKPFTMSADIKMRLPGWGYKVLIINRD